MLQLTLTKPTNQIQLRDYQQRAYDSLFNKINQGEKRIMINAPCSWGKTAFISQVICHFRDLKQRILFVVPALSLIEQAQRDFYQAGIQCGIIAGGYKFDNWRVQVASIQTLTRRTNLKWKPDVIILDECHQTAFSGWVKRELPLLLDGEEIVSKSQLSEYFNLLGLSDASNLTWKDITSHYNYINKKEGLSKETRTGYSYLKKYQGVIESDHSPNNRLIIGLTATPWRLKKTEQLSDIFNSQIKCETPQEMIELSMLTPCVYYRLKEVDLSKVKTSAGGDYRDDQLSLAMSNPEVVKDAVENYKRICPDRKFICFAVNLDHAHLLAQEFNNQGIESVLISGDMPDKKRQPLFSRIRDLNDSLMGLVSVGCISVGFSVNEVSCIVHCRPTKSPALYIQGIGRGQRLSEGKENCIVLDQAGNTQRFGLIENITYPDIADDNRFTTGDVPIKECNNCGLLQPIVNRFCSNCNHEFEITGKSKTKPKGKLELVISDKDQPIFKRYQLNLAIAYQHQHDPSWARMKTKEETGGFPHKEWGIGAIFGKSGLSSIVNQEKYWNHLKQLSVKLEKRQQDQLKQGHSLSRIKVYDYHWMQREFKLIFGFEFKKVKIANRPNLDLFSTMKF